jgi:HTH-type transcriptional regulator / antitoxin HipB
MALISEEINLFYRDRSMNAVVIAELVKQHREAAGLSQAELAALAGVGKTAVFAIEHGKETIRLNVLLKVLGALNIELNPSSPLLKAVSSNLDNHAAR